MSNLIPITRIYDIYPKYTYSNDVKKFMDEIVDIDRANVFTEADMVNILDEIRAEIEQIADEEQKHDEKWALGLRYAVKIIDKYKAELSRRDILPKYEVKVITRGNCMICGKKLDEGLFFCSECEAKAESEE